MPDRGHGSQRHEPVWVTGKPSMGWFGLKLPEQRLPVRAYRCPQCGSLELFASESRDFPGG